MSFLINYTIQSTLRPIQITIQLFHSEENSLGSITFQSNKGHTQPEVHMPADHILFILNVLLPDS